MHNLVNVVALFVLAAIPWTVQTRCTHSHPCDHELNRDGNWGCWEAWTPCNKRCGWGSRSRVRACNNPSRHGSGHSFCAGNPKQTEDCSTVKFEVVPTVEVSETSNSLAQLSPITLSQCMMECAKTFPSCKALEHNPKTKICVTKGAPKLSKGVPAEHYFEPMCDRPHPVHEPTPAEPFSDGCQVKDKCYSSCGESKYVNQTISGHEVTLRYMWFNLSHLEDMHFPGARKLTLHAQTVILDKPLTIPYHMVIVARQVHLSDSWSFKHRHHSGVSNASHCLRDFVYDCSENKKLQLLSFYHGTFRVDIYAAETAGVRSCDNGRLIVNPKYDVIALTLAVTCAHGLVSSLNSDEISAAENILTYIKHVTKDTTGFAIADEAYNLQSLASGLLDVLSVQKNYNQRFVPVLSQAAYQRHLSLYSSLFAVFIERYERLHDNKRHLHERIRDFQALIDEYEQARSLQEQKREFAEQRMLESKLTLAILKDKFNNSMVDLKKKRDVFEDGLNTYEHRAKVKNAFGFIKIIGQVVGAISGLAGASKGGAADDVGNAILEGVNGLLSSVTDLADMALQLHNMLQTIRKISRASSIIELAAEQKTIPTNVTATLEDLKEIANLHVQKVTWDTMKNTGDSYLSQTPIPDIGGATDYRKALSDMANWGKGLTEHVIAYGELSKIYMMDAEAEKVTEDNIKRMKELKLTAQHKHEISAELLSHAAKEVVQVQLSAARMVGHFCQSFFYFMFSQCDPAIRIHNSNTLKEVQDKLHDASLQHLEPLKKFGKHQPTPHTTYHILADTTRNYSMCNDVADCPLSKIKENKHLLFTVGLDSPDFAGLERFRFQEMRVFFPGIKFTNPRYSKLMVHLKKMPMTYDRYNGKIYNFTTIGREHTFTFDYETHRITNHACVHTGVNQAVYELSPFGTWTLEVDDPFLDADLKNVYKIEIFFLGSAIQRGLQPPSNPANEYGHLGSTLSPRCGGGGGLTLNGRSVETSGKNIAKK